MNIGDLIVALIGVVVGAALGFGISYLQENMRLKREREELLKHILAEISPIIDYACSFSKDNVEMFSVTEFPLIITPRMINIGILPVQISKKIMSACYALNQAEELRRLADEKERDGNVDGRKCYAIISKDWLKKPCDLLKEIKEDIEKKGDDFSQ